MRYVPSVRLDYRCLVYTDWPFYQALNQDLDVMRFISDLCTDEEIRINSFEKRLQPWHKVSLVKRHPRYSAGQPN
ncbi:hypothetical protein [Pantoea agglomerans]|uniref:hypothetical protein n=1 Tax=Enterobacter agglomerans TaxID=549 RepID=UPI001A8EC6F7|nr:hypothetical protein [Pantoea agglomerans]MBN9930367.1 hypothetical protein [Pantoea agglomerans]MDH1170459.1 hypothetical protein [Pantoea agglomerans]